MCIFRWQTILTRISPQSQKTIYNFKLVVSNTTKHTKHGRSCDIVIWWPSNENVALGPCPRATFSTSGSSYFNVRSLPCITRIFSLNGAFSDNYSHNSSLAVEANTAWIRRNFLVAAVSLSLCFRIFVLRVRVCRSSWLPCLFCICQANDKVRK